MKEFLRKSKAQVAGLMAALMVGLTVVPGFCATPTITETMTTELGTLGTQLLGIVSVVIGAAIPIIGAVIAVKKGVGWFKSLAK
jgi:uncharacterized protein (DUF697 family)